METIKKFGIINDNNFDNKFDSKIEFDDKLIISWLNNGNFIAEVLYSYWFS